MAVGLIGLVRLLVRLLIGLLEGLLERLLEVNRATHLNRWWRDYRRYFLFWFLGHHRHHWLGLALGIAQVAMGRVIDAVIVRGHVLAVHLWSMAGWVAMGGLILAVIKDVLVLAIRISTMTGWVAGPIVTMAVSRLVISMAEVLD